MQFYQTRIWSIEAISTVSSLKVKECSEDNQRFKFPMSGHAASEALRVVAKVSATLLGGSFALGFLTSFVSDRINMSKQKTYGRPCWTCKAIGYYKCKLCKGNDSIEWSPLYDPVVINPCVCPTCDGSKVQRCLNCLGCGSI